MKTRKRLSALVLALCLVLSMTVPAVWAADPDVVEYNFDFAGRARMGEFTANGNCLQNEDAAKAVSTAYENGSLNWNYKETNLERTYAANKTPNELTFFRTNDTAKKNYWGYFRGRTLQDEWIAFTIDAPGEGDWNLYLDHTVSMYGANKVNVYLLSSTTEDIGNALVEENLVGSYCCYDAEVENETDANTSLYKTAQLGKWTCQADETYILVLKAAEQNPDKVLTKSGGSGMSKKLAANIYLTQLTMTSAEAYAVTTTDVGAITYYTTEAETAEAINTATSGTVKVLNEVTTTGAITVNAGVTLDLNGKTLIATEFTCNGTLADNSDGSGMVKTVKGKTINVADNALLLYDSTNTGYRVYSGYDLTPYGSTLQPLDNDGQRLWIKLTFDNKDAYRVIATGYSDFSIGAAMTWTPDGGTAVTKTLTFEDSHEQTWGENMQKAENYGFYISFTGFEDLASGTLELTPVAWGCNQAADTAISSETSITYTHTAAE